MDHDLREYISTKFLEGFGVPGNICLSSAFSVHLEREQRGYGEIIIKKQRGKAIVKIEALALHLSS